MAAKKKQKKLTAKENTSKVEEVKEIKKALVEGRDAVVLINIFSPNSEPKEFKIRIPKITNNAPPPHREPSYIAGLIMGALRRKYGDRVK